MSERNGFHGNDDTPGSLRYTLGEAKLALLSGMKFGDIYPHLRNPEDSAALKHYFVHGVDMITPTAPPYTSTDTPPPFHIESLREAMERGFTGNICTMCGGSRMIRNGTCEVCTECGATSGCS